MSEKPRARMSLAMDFVEVAETLGVNTVDVMAMLPDEVVLFTPHPNDDDPMIYKAQLGRDSDGILRAGPWHTVAQSSEFQAGVEELINKAMEDPE